MAIPLRQSTAGQELPLGYFVDSLDGNTEETGLTIANTDIKLWKHGATALVSKNSGGATYISNGLYDAVLDATDTDTAGGLVAFVHVAGALPVRVECVVLPAASYDGLMASGETLADVYQAKSSLVDDEANAVDRYLTIWFKNGVPITTGITSPTLQTIKASDGADLIAETAMTQIGATGLYKFDAALARIVNGAAYILKTTAVIGGATRVWFQPISRDS